MFFNRENTVKITPFVKNEEACKQNCSWNSKCNYFKYLTNDGPSSQVPLCYHLKKCSPRMIRQTECPLERNNYIDHYLFTQSPEECEMRQVRKFKGLFCSPLINNFKIIWPWTGARARWSAGSTTGTRSTTARPLCTATCTGAALGAATRKRWALYCPDDTLAITS